LSQHHNEAAAAADDDDDDDDDDANLLSNGLHCNTTDDVDFASAVTH